VRALEESAEAIVAKKRSERGEERRAEEPKSRAKEETGERKTVEACETGGRDNCDHYPPDEERPDGATIST
jgi:hypothetical protein